MSSPFDSQPSPPPWNPGDNQGGSPRGNPVAGSNPFDTGRRPQGGEHSGLAAQQHSPFGAGGAAVGRLTFAGPPMNLLIVALAAAVVGAALAFLPWHFLRPIGWLLAGPVAILALGYFTTTDNKRRASGLYAGNPAAKALYVVALVAALAAVVITALLTAFWVGRL